MIRTKSNAAEESGKDGLPRRNLAHGRECADQISRNDTQKRAQLAYVPECLSENLDRRPPILPRFGIKFSGQKFDQRGFAGTVRPKNCGMLSRPNGKVDFAQNRCTAPHNGRSQKSKYRRPGRRRVVHAASISRPRFLFVEIPE